MDYPENCVWYIEAYSKKAPDKSVSGGSAVAIRLRPKGGIGQEKTFLLTCCHVLRGDSGGGPLLDRFFAWKPGDKKYEGDAKEVRISPHDKNDHPTGALDQQQRKSVAQDWVLLEFVDPETARTAKSIKWIRNDQPARNTECRIIGYPGANAKFQDNKVQPRNPGLSFPVHGFSGAAIRLTGDATRPGVSGGGIFEKATDALVGIHRARDEEAMGVHGVSSEHILRKLDEWGLEHISSSKVQIQTTEVELVPPHVQHEMPNKAAQAEVAADPNDQQRVLSPTEVEIKRRAKEKLESLTAQIFEQSVVTRNFVAQSNGIPKASSAELAKHIFQQDLPVDCLRKCVVEKKRGRVADEHLTRINDAMYRLVGTVAPISYTVAELEEVESGNGWLKIPSNDRNQAVCSGALFKGVSAKVLPKQEWNFTDDLDALGLAVPANPDLGATSNADFDYFVSALGIATRTHGRSLQDVKNTVSDWANNERIYFAVMFSEKPNTNFLQRVVRAFPDLVVILASSGDDVQHSELRQKIRRIAETFFPDRLDDV